MKAKTLHTLALALVINSASASPTNNEYIKCNKLAVALLEMCLADTSPSSNEQAQCWQRSESQFKQCKAKVKNRHIKDPARINAEKAANYKAKNSK